MTGMTETRRTLLHVPDTVAAVYFALCNEDFEDLALYRDLFEKVWHDASHTLKKSIVRALIREFNRNDIHEGKDLNNFFSNIVGYQIPQYETVK